MSQQLGDGFTFAVDADELEDFALRNELPEAEVEKARWDLERARGRGFEHCRAVFVEYAYDGLWERASATNGKLDWGRGQGVVDRNLFRDGQLVRDPAWTPPPDERDWQAHGLNCRVTLTRLGYRYGYVEVLPAHPWFRLDYNRCAQKPPCGEGYCDHRPEAIVSVHGGITFSGEHYHDGRWWFGFDCAHAGDAPSPEAVASNLRRYGSSFSMGEEHHWTLEETATETEHMAEQIAAVLT